MQTTWWTMPTPPMPGAAWYAALEMDVKRVIGGLKSGRL